MTRQFKKLAYSLYECKYHIVFCLKYRYKVLRDEVAKYPELRKKVLGPTRMVAWLLNRKVIAHLLGALSQATPFGGGH